LATVRLPLIRTKVAPLAKFRRLTLASPVVLSPPEKALAAPVITTGIKRHALSNDLHSRGTNLVKIGFVNNGEW
jgi:hypothetical protein